ncbi:hypothetical protein [Chryseobacterium viscerum]|nr:hypothetical protein [Chryseobacterium viscerum]
MNSTEDKKEKEETLQNQDLENNPSPKKTEKEKVPKSSTNKSGKTGG